jgi:hypothetical protein
MEGACGNIERARLLFGYGLSLYPNNTKILNLYACFEEEQGEVELVRELHQRALGIDSASITSMHNRWAVTLVAHYVVGGVGGVWITSRFHQLCMRGWKMG